MTDNAILWYKVTPNQALEGGDDYLHVPDSQKIQFNNSTILMTSLTYTPDIKLKQTANTNSGKRRSTLTDNGSGGIHIVIVLEILSTETDAVNKIFDFINTPQVTNDMIHGVFCFDYPTLPKFTIEADTTKGLGIGPLSNIKAKVTNKIGSYICEIHLYSGGII